MTLHIDGFDQFSGENKLTEALLRAGYGTTGTVAAVSGRAAGSSAISCQKGTVVRNVQDSGNNFSLGFAHTFDDRGSCVKLALGAEAIVLWFNLSNGLPMMNDVQGNALPIIGTWYYIEMAIDKAAGTCKLYINGKEDSTFPLTAGMKLATYYVITMGYLPPSSYSTNPLDDNSVKTYDDFYWRTDVPLGPVVITTRFPTTDNHVQWFKAGNENTHAATVSKRPPTPLNNYIASDTVGQEDRFTSNKLLTNQNEIVATGMVVLARKSESLVADLRVFIGGTAEDRYDELVVNADWRTQYVCYEQFASDTVAKIQSSQFGVAVVN